MHWTLLLFSMLPVVTFALVETLADSRKAVVAAIVVAGFEFVFDSILLGFVEIFSAVSLSLFVILGAVALRRGRMEWFKFQPVVLGLFVAATFWIYDGWIATGEPLFAQIVEKHLRINDILPTYQRGYFADYARTMSTSLPFLLIAHAALTGYAAVKLSTWSWCGVRVLGFYAMATALFYAERLFQVSY